MLTLYTESQLFPCERPGKSCPSISGHYHLIARGRHVYNAELRSGEV